MYSNSNTRMPITKVSNELTNKSLFNMILIVLLIMVALFFISWAYDRLTDCIENVSSDIDGKKYHVRDQGTDNNKKEAANHLASISVKVKLLIDYMVKNNLPDNISANRLQTRWKDCKFRETSKHEDTAAYTVNKSDEMRICIRDRNDGILNINTSTFVVLHELAHMMSVSYGHNDEFKSSFNYLVHLASALGIYKPEDFDSNPVDYCGVEINTSPCSNNTCEYTSIPLI